MKFNQILSEEFLPGIPAPAVTEIIKKFRFFKVSFPYKVFFTGSESESSSSVAGNNHGITTSLADPICKRASRTRRDWQQQEYNEQGKLHGDGNDVACPKDDKNLRKDEFFSLTQLFLIVLCEFVISLLDF